MSTINKTTDTTLVNRAGVDHRITLDKMSTLQDTDLLIINRAGVDYRCTAKDAKSALGGGGGAVSAFGSITVTGIHDMDGSSVSAAQAAIDVPFGGSRLRFNSNDYIEFTATKPIEKLLVCMEAISGDTNVSLVPAGGGASLMSIRIIQNSAPFAYIYTMPTPFLTAMRLVWKSGTWGYVNGIISYHT
jgi:hypothetical protein